MTINLKKISFPDKQNNDDMIPDDYNTNYFTPGNINEMKKAINNSIDSILEIDLRIKQNVEKRLTDLNELVNNFSENPPFKSKLIEYIACISGEISQINLNLNLINHELSGSNVNSIFNRVINNEKNIEKNNNKITYLSGITDSILEDSTHVPVLDKKVKELFNNQKSLSSVITDNISDISNLLNYQTDSNNFIRSNYNEITKLTNVINKMQEDIATVKNINYNYFNEILRETTSLFFYNELISERMFTQDARTDHLERLIRGINDPPNWDDWNLVFRLLNLLKLKIAKLSITRRVPVNEVVITSNEISTFKLIINELERKLTLLPENEIYETSIKVEEIAKVAKSIEDGTLVGKTLDPYIFDFYPFYPPLNEFTDDNLDE